MRFLVDECTGPAVAKWLRDEGHEVFSVYEQARGLSDEAVLGKAYNEAWVLITNDKDFGERIYRDRAPHRGMILLRLEDERSVVKIAVLDRLLEEYSDRLLDRVTVVTESSIRFSRQQGES